MSVGTLEQANAPSMSLLAKGGFVLLPLAALALFMGVASPVFTRTIEPSVEALVQQVRGHQQAPAARAPGLAPSASRPSAPGEGH